MHKVVHKPWGKEEWLELNDSYCYKRIYINAGYKTSFQYHHYPYYEHLLGLQKNHVSDYSQNLQLKCLDT